MLQRVTQASVSIAGRKVAGIGTGLVVLLGVASGDTGRDIEYLADKVLHLRIFMDSAGKFNQSVMDIRGELLLVSQFTLMADTRHGRRPGFTGAATAEAARSMYTSFLAEVSKSGLKVATGVFQEHMLVEIHNDGPVTIMLDSREKFEKAAPVQEEK